MRRLASTLLLLVACAGCVARRAAAPLPVCHSCFWKHQAEAFQQELVAVYSDREYTDPLVDAERRLLIAVVTEDREALCEVRTALAALAGTAAARDPARGLFVAEVAAFTAEECDADPAAAFREAAAKAREASQDWKAGVYADVARGRFRPRFGDTEIVRAFDVPAGAKSFVLGASRIVVPAGTRVGAQVERTVRDWISYQLDWDGTARPAAKDALVDWHEGARLRDLLDATTVEVLPLSGALAARNDERWLAADGDGVFRYQVLDDKIQYPTTLAWRGLALIVDTHGVSALVEAARREGVTLVVGCGDTPHKMKAAFDLARRGVNVWFPCDRYAGDVLGYDAPGTLIGSAPVRREGDHAVIGDRPIQFSMTETFVVEDFAGEGPLRYYDAPARYFRALTDFLPLAVDYVAVEDSGQSDRVVARAEELGVEAIGVRVQTDADATPVREWLAVSPRHRAVLFHTAPYPAGYALFTDFPAQTTFGDPRPRF